MFVLGPKTYCCVVHTEKEASNCTHKLESPSSINNCKMWPTQPLEMSSFLFSGVFVVPNCSTMQEVAIWIITYAAACTRVFQFLHIESSNFITYVTYFSSSNQKPVNLGGG